MPGIDLGEVTVRCAIISDIHGNVAALEAVLKDIARRGVDITINLGDCVTGPLWPKETLELLLQLSLPTVRGNHDRWLQELPVAERTASMNYCLDTLSQSEVAMLHGLPSQVDFDGTILALHGTPQDDAQYLLEDREGGRLCLAPSRTVLGRLGEVSHSLILCGHSHHQHSALVGGAVIVNPGSVGCPRYCDSGLVDDAEASSPHARYAVATRAARRWTVDLISLDYDWQPVLTRARTVGREDWATAFVRGVA